jgi:hypothetical protein
MFCFLWDMVEEGIDEVLDRLQGEAGMSGVSVTTQYPNVDQLRPHMPGGSARFRSKGGAQFHFDRGGYASTRLRPVTAAWLGKANPLARVGEACRARNMAFRAWHVCCHNPAMAARYPEHAVKDIFGAPDPMWLCPANLEVREWVRCTVEDITAHYPFEAVELEAACFPTRCTGGADAKVGVALGEVDQWLLGLCFCESCRQMAARDGLDMTAIADLVRGHVERLFETAEPATGPLEAFVADRPLLGDYARWRCGQVADLLKTIRSSCPVRLVVHRRGDRFRGGNDFGVLASHYDAVMPLFYESNWERMAARVAQARREAGASDRVELALSACQPPCESSATLTAGMKRATDLGIRSVNVYNYGLMPLSRLDWVSHASRYARREAG